MTRGSLIDVAHPNLQLSLITALAATAYQTCAYANFCRHIKYELSDSSYPHLARRHSDESLVIVFALKKPRRKGNA